MKNKKDNKDKVISKDRLVKKDNIIENYSLDYKIISSGSIGNSVRIEDILVDIGVSYKALKDELKEVKFIFITHIHTDHLRIATYNAIRKNYPRIKFIGNYEVENKVKLDLVVASNHTYKVGKYRVETFECIHDVLTFGYVWEVGNQKIIYATDTSSMMNAPKVKYDWFFIESNHCEKKLELVKGKSKGGYNPFLAGKRHLSTQQAKTFYYLNRRSKASKFVELHKSSRFY